MSTLLDTWQFPAIDAVAQGDLGRRAHRHQSVYDLRVMAAEILPVAMSRKGWVANGLGAGRTVTVDQIDRLAPDGWTSRRVPVGERPPIDESGSPE